MAQKSTVSRFLSWLALLLMVCLGLVLTGTYDRDIRLTDDVRITINRRFLELCVSYPDDKDPNVQNDGPAAKVETIESFGQLSRRDTCRMCSATVKPVDRYNLPLWWGVVAASSIVVGLLVLNRKPRIGCCKRCNYSLTGNQSGICPECGLAIETSKPGIDS